MPSPSGTQWVTSDDVILLTLENLGVLSVGQSVDPEDYGRVQASIQPTFNKLANLQVCYLPQLDAIPAGQLSDLSWIMAQECAPKFGSNTEDHIRFCSLGLGGPPSQVPFLAGAAALSLIQQLRGRPTGEPARTFYF